MNTPDPGLTVVEATRALNEVLAWKRIYDKEGNLKRVPYQMIYNYVRTGRIKRYSTTSNKKRIGKIQTKSFMDWAVLYIEGLEARELKAQAARREERRRH